MGPDELFQRAVIARRYYLEGRTRVEIAEEFGLSRFKVANCVFKMEFDCQTKERNIRSRPKDIEGFESDGKTADTNTKVIMGILSFDCCGVCVFRRNPLLCRVVGIEWGRGRDPDDDFFMS